jgi:hypothetical protein
MPAVARPLVQTSAALLQFGRLPPAGYAGRVDVVLDPQSLLTGAEAQK